MAKRVALALGSGGARGYAHIGVINELRSRGYEVVGVAGSSMGALVGGLFAAGSLQEFTEWSTTLTQRAVLRLLDPSITAATEGGLFLPIARVLDGQLSFVCRNDPVPTQGTVIGLAAPSVQKDLDQAVEAAGD